MPQLNANHVHILVDYDNVAEINRRRGLLDLVGTMLTTLPEPAVPDNSIADIRLYGGWYERDRPTSLAQELREQIAECFPTVLRVTGPGTGRRVRAVVDLARSLLIRPDADLLDTYRHRRGTPRLVAAIPPAPNCAVPDSCPLSSLHAQLKRPRCPEPACHVELREVFSQPQQKLVDTMLTADAIFAARSQGKIAIVTNDDDLWPGICTAGHLGAAIYHVHPRPGRRTPDLYLPSAPPGYHQCSF